ncbi:hypothetical protein [Terrabacter carboxydivorans]|uniref:Helix-turn-helix domain-containing protein n=1 Tax=Terrabacter carboxydivorans TaxID=619730 RepID=A0ABN3MHZ3_9MICO
MPATATGLLKRARLTLEDLQRTSTPVTSEQWASFDQTVYRLLQELVRTRSGWQPTGSQAVPLYRAFRDYPRPLQPADDRPDFSPKETARLLGTNDTAIRKRILSGTMLAAPTNAGYRIPRSELALHQDPRPAASTDHHPLARLACELGALADLLLTYRMEPSLPELEAGSAAWIGRETLGLAEGAGRRVLALCEPEMADRPLSIARYAVAAAEATAVSTPPLGIQDPAIARSDTSASTEAAALSVFIHQWARAAQAELRAQVPSVEVLKDVTRQGINLYAALHATIQNASIGKDAVTAVQDRLRESAQVLQVGASAWTHTTTGSPPSRDYVAAARCLYATLTQITTAGTAVASPEVTYQALLRGAHEVAWLTTLVTPQASRLIQSEALFIHARHARSDTRRLRAVNNGRLTVATTGDVPNLTTHGWAAERAATSMARALPPAMAAPAHGPWVPLAAQL